MTTWTFYCIRPKPGGGFHFGVRGLEQEASAPMCSSDTLFAALVATAADVGGDAGARAFVAPFEAGTPPYLLTSAFPRAGTLCLLPAPSLKAPFDVGPGQRKLFKRLAFVSPAIFRRWVCGESLDAYAHPDAGKGLFLQDGKIWIAAADVTALPEVWACVLPDTAERGKNWRAWLTTKDGAAWLREQKVWSSGAVDRVTVDRIASASTVFRIGRTVYAEGCGLWIGARWPGAPDPAAQSRLETLLAHLGDRGLGGERSVGYGQFTHERIGETLDLPAVQPDGPALTLSRYLPRRDELPGALRGRAAYRLDPIVGCLGAPNQTARRRKQIRMFAEGSVFTPVGAAPWGRLVDVRPEGWTAHPIWRYGYACPVGVLAEEAHDA